MKEERSDDMICIFLKEAMSLTYNPENSILLFY